MSDNQEHLIFSPNTRIGFRQACKYIWIKLAWITEICLSSLVSIYCARRVSDFRLRDLHGMPPMRLSVSIQPQINH